MRRSAQAGCVRAGRVRVTFVPAALLASGVVACITSTTDVIGPATTFGGGRVHVQRAVDALRAGDC